MSQNLYHIVLNNLLLGAFLLGAVPGVKGQSGDLTGKPVAVDTFPSVEAETLTDQPVRFPESLQGKVSLLLVAFERDGEAQADTWYEAAGDHFEIPSELQLFSLLILSKAYYPISGPVEKGIRNIWPEERHSNTATHYGNLWKFYRLFNVENRGNVHVFLLDPHGKIRFHTTGFATSEKVNQMKQHCTLLISKE